MFEDTVALEIAVFDESVQELHTYAQFGEIENVDRNDEDTTTMEIAVSDSYVQNDHSYASTQATDELIRNQVFKYRCDVCNYRTNKKSAYDDHKAENCEIKPMKDMKCPICDRLFTYRTLRHHLNHFATGHHKSTGKHAKYTPFHHAFLLKQHNLCTQTIENKEINKNCNKKTSLISILRIQTSLILSLKI